MEQGRHNLRLQAGSQDLRRRQNIQEESRTRKEVYDEICDKLFRIGFEKRDIMLLAGIGLGCKTGALISRRKIAASEIATFTKRCVEATDIVATSSDEKIKHIQLNTSHLFLNSKKIGRRIDKEPSISNFVNIHDLSQAADQGHKILQRQSNGTMEIEDELQLGFLLGYPESAIHAYRNSRELAARGGVEPMTMMGLYRYLEMSPEEFKKQIAEEPIIQKNDWRSMARSYFRQNSSAKNLISIIKSVYDRYIEFEKNNMALGLSLPDMRERKAQLRRETERRNRPNIATIYREIYGLTPHEIEFVFNGRLFELADGSGVPAQHFYVNNTSPYNGLFAPDTVALITETKTAFSNAGVELKEVTY